ncbi:Pentapeptide repeat-containing protein [Candidatus Methanophagaceae archaeon]|nr:Pentapeptide repeat-containing protein [Methanophagales archaeon]
MCEYTFRDGERCKEEAMPNSKYCVLHVELPEDEESDEFKRINELKEEIVKEKISKEDFYFDGAKLLEVDFSGMTIEGSLTFANAIIKKDASFVGAEIGGDASFNEAKIGGDAWFNEAKIGGDASFNEAEIGGDASFNEAKIGRDAWFVDAKIGRDAWFVEAEIGGDASFDEAEIGGGVWFKEAKIGGGVWFKEAKIGGGAWFVEAEIGRDVSFSLTEIKGVCSFKDAKFKKPQAQEVACRTARKTQERIGDRVSADYHFYREMEAKRKQKHPIIRVLELPVQYIFGYGVHPWRVITTWLVTVFVLAFVYWLGHGVVAADSFWGCLYFSIVTAATPGYGGYHPNPGCYQCLASFEAIFGTFMWAAFIATFARKYMR